LVPCSAKPHAAKNIIVIIVLIIIIIVVIDTLPCPRKKQ